MHYLLFFPLQAEHRCEKKNIPHPGTPPPAAGRFAGSLGRVRAVKFFQKEHSRIVVYYSMTIYF
jgi:hypothetical protein